MHEELLAGTNLTAKMQSDKDKFIARHKIKKSAHEAIEKAADGKIKGHVTIPRKRSDNEDGSEDDLAAIEQKVRSKAAGGKGGANKGFSNKRQRTK